MYRPSRARRLLKWTGAGFSLAILATWWFTIPHDVYCRIPRIGLLFVGEGYFGVFATNTPEFASWNDSYGSAVWAAEPALEYGMPSYDQWPCDPEDAWQASPLLGDLARRALIVFFDGGGVAIPLSLALTTVLLPTAFLFYRDRRRRPVSRQISRLSQSLKWVGTGLAISVLGVWCLSFWYDMSISLPGRLSLGTEDAVIATFRAEAEYPLKARWTVEFNGPQLGGLGLVWPHKTSYYVSPLFGLDMTYVPFWLPLLITALPTAWLWHRDRRRIPPGCCPRCGYDLTGNTSGACSECGAKAPLSPASA